MREARISFKCSSNSSNFHRTETFGSSKEHLPGQTNSADTIAAASFARPLHATSDSSATAEPWRAKTKHHIKRETDTVPGQRERVGSLTGVCVCISKTRSTCGRRCVKMNDRVLEWNSPNICHHPSGRHTTECTSVRCQQGRARSYLVVCRFSPPFFPSHVRKWVVIVMSQMVGATFWHDTEGQLKEAVNPPQPPKKWKWVESCASL